MEAVNNQNGNTSGKQRSNRNGAISLIKLIAAIMVVLAHVSFPGTFGSVICCLARFTVPFFFMVSGFYAYRTPAEKLGKRLKKIGQYILIANLVYFLWACCSNVIIDHKDLGTYLGSVINVKRMANFVFVGKNPFNGLQLWYLNAMALVYIAYIVYVRFWDSAAQVNYRTLYIFGACGLLFQIALGVKAQAVGLKVDRILYRYCLFYGLPIFAFGIFLREYGERVATNFRLSRSKSVLLIVIGIALSLIQWFGLGRQEMPLGMLLVEVGIAMLVMVRPGPQLFSGTTCLLMEKTSTIVYIIHILINRIVKKLKFAVPLFAKVLSMKSFYPVFLAVISLAIGILIALISMAIDRKRAH